jgi:hypothetical protein
MPPEQSIPTQALTPAPQPCDVRKRRIQIRTTIMVCSMTALTGVNSVVAQRGFYIRVPAATSSCGLTLVRCLSR